MVDFGRSLKADPLKQSFKDSQHIETRTMQIDEIARVFGVPRPLVGVQETSWGSGIATLGQLFARYTLNPWFVQWQQTAALSLFSEEEAETIECVFNVSALLRGSPQEQADFFAKSLGAGVINHG